MTPAPAESNEQLPTSASINSLDASSTDKVETNSGKPSKKRLKDMNPEERKQYNREKSALSRAKKAASGVGKTLSVAVTDSSAAPLSSTDNVSLTSMDEGIVLAESFADKAGESNKKAARAEHVENISEEPIQKRYRDMNSAERKEYSRLNKRKSRAKKNGVDHDTVSLRSVDTIVSDSHSVAASTSTRASNKRRNSQTPAEARKCDAKRRADLHAEITAFLESREEESNVLDDKSTTDAGNINMTSCMTDKIKPTVEQPQIPERPSSESKKDCKIRIGLVDLFDVEVDAIAIPQ